MQISREMENIMKALSVQKFKIVFIMQYVVLYTFSQVTIAAIGKLCNRIKETINVENCFVLIEN